MSAAGDLPMDHFDALLGLRRGSSRTDERNLVDLSEFAGALSGTWTLKGTDSVLAQVSARLGRRVVCLYEPDGALYDSFVVVGDDGALHRPPAGLADLLTDGDAAVLIDADALGPTITVGSYTELSDHNWMLPG